MRKCGLAFAALWLCACGREAAGVTVSVAASLQNAMPEIAAAAGMKVTFNFSASGTLAQQIEQGAPVDVFIAAAPKPMDGLAAKGLLLAGTRRDLLRNTIVLIASKGDGAVKAFDDLAGAGVKLIALGDPGSVPAGDYGRQVLRSLKLWDALQSKLVLAKDVRQVLSYVETGNAEAGLVYSTTRASRIVCESWLSRRRVARADHVSGRDPSRVAQRCRGAVIHGVSLSPRAAEIFRHHGFTTVGP